MSKSMTDNKIAMIPRWDVCDEFGSLRYRESPTGDWCEFSKVEPLLDLISEMEVASEKIVPVGWEPISSAPKTDELILGFCPTFYQGSGGFEVVMWHVDGWYNQLGLPQHPTHWMSLPDKPEREQ